MWYPEAAGTLAGTPAFSLMDMSRRKELQFLSGCGVRSAAVWVGWAPRPGAGMQRWVGPGSEGVVSAEGSSVGVGERNLGGPAHSRGGGRAELGVLGSRAPPPCRAAL